ncbi:MAG: hypothetical protein KKE57_10300 [Proteobacteria bacterium]|nr:hypothetical protein [Pseudomonadota bacterium]
MLRQSPSFRGTWLSEEEFPARWHDLDSKTNTKLEHFMMVLLGKEPAARAVEHMDEAVARVSGLDLRNEPPLHLMLS